MCSDRWARATSAIVASAVEVLLFQVHGVPRHRVQASRAEVASRTRGTHTESKLHRVQQRVRCTATLHASAALRSPVLTDPCRSRIASAEAV
eukprot:5737087-Prymnesium_polylepis.2